MLAAPDHCPLLPKLSTFTGRTKDIHKAPCPSLLSPEFCYRFLLIQKSPLVAFYVSNRPHEGWAFVAVLQYPGFTSPADNKPPKTSNQVSTWLLLFPAGGSLQWPSLISDGTQSVHFLPQLLYLVATQSTSPTGEATVYSSPRKRHHTHLAVQDLNSSILHLDWEPLMCRGSHWCSQCHRCSTSSNSTSWVESLAHLGYLLCLLLSVSCTWAL